MTIETHTITFPAHWASAVVNGDESGLDDAEIARMNAWLEDELAGGWYVVSTTEDEPRFTWSYDLYGGNADGGMVLDYVVHRET